MEWVCGYTRSHQRHHPRPSSIANGTPIGREIVKAETSRLEDKVRRERWLTSWDMETVRCGIDHEILTQMIANDSF